MGFIPQVLLNRQYSLKQYQSLRTRSPNGSWRNGCAFTTIRSLLKLRNVPYRKERIVTVKITKFQGGRLQLKVTCGTEGNIIPVDITIYDLDGQQGLNVPYSPERNVLTDIVGNMGNATGSSFSMSSSTGQQITSDSAKCYSKGISGYFSKK